MVGIDQQQCAVDIIVKRITDQPMREALRLLFVNLSTRVGDRECRALHALYGAVCIRAAAQCREDGA